MENSYVQVSAAELTEFARAVLVKTGIPEIDCTLISDTMVQADLRGVQSHGTARLPTYVQRVRAGVMVANAQPKVVRETSATALVDAGNGFGQVAAAYAMNLALQKAREHGVSWVSVRNSNHFGIAAYYAMMALKADMVGLVVTNASPAMAPFGGVTPLLGTNPLSIAIPAGKRLPVVVDMATSQVARGKIRLAATKGEGIPIGWARDRDGRPTDDPQEALKGSLEPVGGVKGVALSLAIDVLCGLLSGTALTGEVKNVTDVSGPSKTAHSFVALNVSAFVNPAEFKANMDAVIDNIHSAKRAAGVDRIYVPGEIEFELVQKRKAEGIPISRKVLQLLHDLAEELGVKKLLD